MIFSAPIFLFLFLPLTLSLFALIKRAQQLNWLVLFLIAASLFFYAFWKIDLLFVILLSIGVNYFISKRLTPPKKAQGFKKLYLVGGILFNLGLLFYFKYKNFFLENVCQLLDCQLYYPELILPLGISFFTFQQIAYLVDRYKDEQDHTSLSEYALFVSFFPQLIAGPIVHHKELLPQLRRLTNKISPEYIWRGITLFSIGLFKKTVIADQLAINVKPVFDKAETADALSMADAWIGTLSYSFQIYFDFSAYSDMAMGLALMFGIILPLNFNSPYKAVNIREFWQRWHMTLTRFLKEHIYIPLGGNRAGPTKLYRNLAITLLIGGLWHGAAWTFIIWGALHGLALCLHRFLLSIFSRAPLVTKFMDIGFGQILTLGFIIITWVIFRAESTEGALSILQSLVDTKELTFPEALKHDPHIPYLIKELPFIEFGSSVFDAVNVKTSLWVLPILLLGVMYLPNSWQIVGLDESSCMQAASGKKITFKDSLLKGKTLTAVFAALLFVISLLFIDQPAEFLYFDF